MSKQLEKIKQLIANRETARMGGGEKAIAKQHERANISININNSSIFSDIFFAF